MSSSAIPLAQQPLLQLGNVQNPDVAAALTQVMLSTPYYRFLNYLAASIGASNIVYPVSVTGATEVMSPSSPVDGQFLAVKITQDGIGHPVSWSSDFVYAPAIAPTPNLVSVVFFAGIDGKWVHEALSRHA